jgi:hypothetical protein
MFHLRLLLANGHRIQRGCLASDANAFPSREPFVPQLQVGLSGQGIEIR